MLYKDEQCQLWHTAAATTTLANLVYSLAMINKGVLRDAWYQIDMQMYDELQERVHENGFCHVLFSLLMILFGLFCLSFSQCAFSWHLWFSIASVFALLAFCILCVVSACCMLCFVCCILCFVSGICMLHLCIRY